LGLPGFTNLRTLHMNSIEDAQRFEFELVPCTDCKRFDSSIKLEKWNFGKPCTQYRTHTAWRPEHVKVVYVAESPPGTSEGYFYEPKHVEGYSEILRDHLFDLLEIDRSGIEQALKVFKERGYFLTDAVKCRCDKGERSHPPKTLAVNCGRKWLERELEILQPDRICVLGKTGKEALEVVPGYELLKEKKVGRDCGTILNARKSVLIWVFPSDRAAQYYAGKEDAFYKFASQ